MSQVVHIGPNPGPQSVAFASCADVTVYGGGAGGGKSWLTLLRFAVHADRNPGYQAIIFRREKTQVMQAGGLWEESMGLFPAFGAKPNLSLHQWRWPNGSLIQFRGLEHAPDVLDYQGAQLAEYAFEEGTHFQEQQFWYLFSRLRSRCWPVGGGQSRALITCNPDPDSWIRKLIDWWIGSEAHGTSKVERGLPIQSRAGKRRYFVRDGDALIWGDTADEVRSLAPHITADPHNQPKSVRFIPALLVDNPKGDPTYASRLNALSKVDRDRLLGGNWDVRAAAGTVFKKEWFEIIDRLPDDIERTTRGWDLAATEPSDTNKDPDWTRGVKLAKCKSGMYVVQDVVSLRGRSHAVDELLMSTARGDGRSVTQALWTDPGSAGKSLGDHHVRMLAGYDVRMERASKDKLTYAKPVSAQAEHRNVKLMRGPWNDAFLKELEAFDGEGKGHDDQVDALSRAFLDLTSVVPMRAVNFRGL